MEQPTIDEPREAPPTWAAPTTTTSEAKITEPQRKFLLDLISKREVKPDQGAKLDLIIKCLRISEDPEEFGMGKKKASELITWFLAQPLKPRNEQDVHQRLGKLEDEEWQRALLTLPAGRYAVENNDDELRFYKKWESRDGARHSLYVQHGQDESKLPRTAQVIIAQKIHDAGIRACAIRYGMEIGECSNCGRRLTNRISRELGIGPVCGGRMFTSDGYGDSPEKAWRDMVNEARDAIIARGDDPDEELDG